MNFIIVPSVIDIFRTPAHSYIIYSKHIKHKISGSNKKYTFTIEFTLHEIESKQPKDQHLWAPRKMGKKPLL